MSPSSASAAASAPCPAAVVLAVHCRGGFLLLPSAIAMAATTSLKVRVYGDLAVGLP